MLFSFKALVILAVMSGGLISPVQCLRSRFRVFVVNYIEFFPLLILVVSFICLKPHFVT